MKDTQRNRGASFHRILDFAAENPVATPVAVPALIAELTTTAATFDALAAKQDLAFGTVHGAVLDRKQLKEELVSFLKGLGEIARVLDPVAYPGLAAEMRLGRAASSFSALTIRARAYYRALVPAKAAFVAYGTAPTVDTDLLAMIEALEAAAARKNGGLAAHIGGTAGLAAICKAGVLIVRKLDAIMSQVYRRDPAKLAAWKAARRVERNPIPSAPAPKADAAVAPAPLAESSASSRNDSPCPKSIPNNPVNPANPVNPVSKAPARSRSKTRQPL